MAIIKIRDANGNVQEILAIRGKDGKDYVLTEEDKQEIANMIGGGGSGTSVVIVQETGESTTKVMSQKAVSEELNRIENDAKFSMNRIEQDLGALIGVERERITSVYGEYLAHANNEKIHGAGELAGEGNNAVYVGKEYTPVSLLDLYNEGKITGSSIEVTENSVYSGTCSDVTISLNGFVKVVMTPNEAMLIRVDGKTIDGYEYEGIVNNAIAVGYAKLANATAVFTQFDYINYTGGMLTDEDYTEFMKLKSKECVEQIEYNSTDGSLQGRVYIVDKNNAQTSRELRITMKADSIPVRDAKSNFYVGDPTNDYHCVNKRYLEQRVLELIQANMPTNGDEVSY